MILVYLHNDIASCVYANVRTSAHTHTQTRGHALAHAHAYTLIHTHPRAHTCSFLGLQQYYGSPVMATTHYQHQYNDPLVAATPVM